MISTIAAACAAWRKFELSGLARKLTALDTQPAPSEASTKRGNHPPLYFGLSAALVLAAQRARAQDAQSHLRSYGSPTCYGQDRMTAPGAGAKGAALFAGG
jgi:hypothetical protein